MKTYSKISWIVSIAAVSVAVGGNAGYALATYLHHQTRTAPPPDAARERKVLYWYDPMAPSQHFDKPGKSPFMDMQLTPKYADEQSGAGVSIDPTAQQNLGVRMATVELGDLANDQQATGVVQFNDRLVAVLQARASGFVEKVYARAPGDVIRQGDPIVDLLIPDWAGAQLEFLALQRSGDKRLTAAARERMRLLGMPTDLIALVERTRKPRDVITVFAPFGGLVQSLDAREGMTVNTGATLVKLNGLDTVWVEAAVSEDRAASLAIAEAVQITLPAFQDQSFPGKISSILPEMDTVSRTVRVRIELDNRDARLRPGMYANISFSPTKNKGLLIPSEAVIRTGKRNLVLLATKDGGYQPVEITLGIEAGGKSIVSGGLEEGQRIVSSGQFLIDSEASLRGVIARASGEIRSPHSDASIAPTDTYNATGIVEALSATDMTVSHGPVAALSWPAMTMTFSLPQTQLVNGVKQGDRVTFSFHKDGEHFVVDSLKTVGQRDD